MSGRKKRMSRAYDVMVAGHLCLDIIPEFPDRGGMTNLDEALRPGALLTVGGAVVSTGGAVSNTGIALKKLGHRVCVSARIGDDEFGSLVLHLMEKNAGKEGIRVDPSARTSYTIVIAVPGRDRSFIHHPGANDDYCADDVDEMLLRHSRVFHFGYPPMMRRMYEEGGRQLVEIFRRAKEANAVTSCDMVAIDPRSPAASSPWREILSAALPHIDIFAPSFEEAVCVLDTEQFFRRKVSGRDLIWHSSPREYRRVADALIGMGGSVVMLKAADRGIYLKTSSRAGFPQKQPAGRGFSQGWAGRELWCPALKAQDIASATGAGDACIAGFLTAFLRGLGPEECLRYAAILGWENLSALDATSGIRNWEETVALFYAEMPENDPHLVEEGWRRDEGSPVWRGPEDTMA